MARKNARGKTWREHAGPYLSKALRSAAKTWKPKSARTNKKKVALLRAMRLKINAQIKTEVEKG